MDLVALLHLGDVEGKDSRRPLESTAVKPVQTSAAQPVAAASALRPARTVRKYAAQPPERHASLATAVD